ncbi:Gfo/Idh/MocA family protein [Ammoniphilus sp. YIM 78166]|uniref:Gfo/Idh/MocA family protein n=1 Tax=Ammoniphilus sp. YIM 78166 TaxID=1644106 RepID=UPI00106FEC55|nr:Gfo/Idh/MocA family oxidoreductase [Ammoniphilus sp. YIM 78166]
MGVGIGFIGTGFVSLMHQQAIQQVENASLVGVYDRNREVLQQKAAEWGVQAFSSVEELVSSPDINVIYVLSPVEYHFEHAKQAITASKHVFIEKPVGLSVEENQTLARLAQEAGVHCVPAHNYVYNPSIWRIRRMIDRGDMGEIVAGWIQYCIYHSDDIFARYPGVIPQIMTHHLYTLLYLLGRPTRVMAMATETRENKVGKEDQAFVTLEMPNGAMISLFAGIRTNDLTSQPGPFMVKILGTEGGGSHSWREGVNTKQVGTHPETWIPYDESYELETDHLVNKVLLGHQKPLSTIEDAVDAQILLDAIKQSVESGRSIEIKWNK